MAITSWEVERLKVLAKKAGLKLNVPECQPMKLSRQEIRSITDSLNRTGGGPIVIRRKPQGRLTIYHSMDSWQKMQDVGRRVGRLARTPKPHGI